MRDPAVVAWEESLEDLLASWDEAPERESASLPAAQPAGGGTVHRLPVRPAVAAGGGGVSPFGPVLKWPGPPVTVSRADLGWYPGT